ncbi:3-phosphoshikimate 1-carboxyvinyltransferase [Pigmentibacter sp. JX0631]|uniref:3-phosphoshikimate 1-carboxyvinyltransferase n=1 Tax=Pigmentibacter sp. JX0631 TaxID=2976982 RepID=UPI002469AEA8|nr:3-phosphoshikimate 1-carboxyvinyltransferase [Pigmentibacter sp. JX0631]WGL60408.1 3-phosphoshikimate 1-carboxyvinyltransferase [Pigmentibacter sp. JX0631]
MQIKKFLFELNHSEDVKAIKITSCVTNSAVKEIWIPGSKSFTNRAIVLAGLCAKPINLYGFLFSEDSYWGLESLKRLGYSVYVDYELKKVVLSPPKHNNNESVELFFGKAGTLARFFPSVILNWQNTFPAFSKLKAKVSGEPQLMRRPLSPLIHALKELNAKIDSDQMPFAIESSQLEGSCKISGKVSGQFLSGLLLSAVGANKNINIERIDNLVQPDYVRMTLQAIEKFGGVIEHDKDLNNFSFQPIKKLGIENYIIEADASTCCYFLALAFLHNFNLKVLNLGFSTLQPDFKFLELLQKMGANIQIFSNEIFVLKNENPTKPKGNFCFDFSQYSDQALTMGAIALFADAPVEIFGVAHIRHHESDRISCFVKNILNLGLKIEEKNDGFIIYPIDKKYDEVLGEFETWEDHRFAMTGFLIASKLNNVIINNPKCVEKTAPQFFNQVQELGFQIESLKEN